MDYPSLNATLKENVIATIQQELEGLESRMGVMEVLLRWLSNDEIKTNEVLYALSKEELSEDVTDVEYELGVVKLYTRDQNHHLIDYMLLLARNIKWKREFLNTSL